MKRKISVMLSLMLIVGMSFGVVQNVFARAGGNVVESSAATAGKWKKETIHNRSYSKIYDHVCGGNVGVWFYTSQNGLPDSMISTSSRRVYIEQYEDNHGTRQLANKYTGYFGTYDEMNVPVSFSLTYTNGNTLETDGCAELYIEFKVSTIGRDKSTTVPIGLLFYCHWTD